MGSQRPVPRLCLCQVQIRRRPHRRQRLRHQERQQEELRAVELTPWTAEEHLEERKKINFSQHFFVFKSSPTFRAIWKNMTF